MFRIEVPEKDKINFICDVYDHSQVYQTMIFVNTKETAIKLEN